MLVLFIWIVIEWLKKNLRKQKQQNPVQSSVLSAQFTFDRVLTVYFDGLIRVQDTTVRLDAIAFRRRSLNFERHSLLGRIANGECNCDVVVEWTFETELIGRIEDETSQWIYDDDG